jgi:hypothetical protein
MKWQDLLQTLRNKNRQRPRSKYNLRRIHGIQQPEIDGFSAAGLADQESVQKKLDGYPGSVIHDLANSTHIEPSRLLALLQESLRLWSKPPRLRRLRSHWADFVLLAVVSVLAAAFFRPAKKAYEVVAMKKISVLQQIRPEDLEEKPSPGQNGETKEQYTGQYVVSVVQQGKELSKAELTSGLTSLRVTIKSSVVPNNPGSTQLVTLVFSARTAPGGGTAIPALLSKMETDGGAQIANLQIASIHEAEVAKWAGSSDAFIVARVP